MKIKLTIKKITPNFFINMYREIRGSKKRASRLETFKKLFYNYYDYDIKRSLEHTNSYSYNDTQQKLISQIVAVYHTIEKGLTMGNFRFGFGEDKMNNLLNLCKSYMDKYGNKDEMLIEALGVISIYNLIHQKESFKLNGELQMKIDHILFLFNSNYVTEQYIFNKENYFENITSQFDFFSNSRYSLRDFDENQEIEINIIEKAIELAQNAPSSCNKQSIRVHLIADTKLLNEVVLLQNGNRGFGDRANKLIIISSDLQCWGGANERIGPYLDSGIYTMNLLYALHFQKIGVCALNWFSSVENDIKLREIINIPQNEVISVILACGGVKDNFKIAKSKRINYKRIMKIH